MAVENDTLFVLLAHLGPEIGNLMIFKMADGGHVALRYEEHTKC